MQRYFSNNKKDNILLLSDNDIYHIFTVMRMKDKELIEVVYNHELYICEINVNEKKNAFIIKKEETTSNLLNITLVIPVLKEQKMDLILQKATELGVSNIIPVITERSIVKIDGKEDKKIERWTKICKEASEQSKRLNIPNISNVMKLKDLEIDGLKMVCSTFEKDNTLKKFLQNNPLYDKITIVAGPEGGLSLNEEKLLVSKGFSTVSLGHLIMRIETVPLYVLSVLNFMNME